METKGKDSQKISSNQPDIIVVLPEGMLKLTNIEYLYSSSMMDNEQQNS